MYNKNLKALQFNETEMNSVDAYRSDIQYKIINSLLELNIDNETEINKKLEFNLYNKQNVQTALNIIINTYSAMVKNSYKNSINSTMLYRGTTNEDISRIKTNKNIGRFISTTKNKSMAEGYFSTNWKNPAILNIKVTEDIPFIDMEDIIQDYGDNWEKERLIAPFTKAEKLEHKSYYNEKNYYYMEISKQDLNELNDKDRKNLYNQILESADEMGDKLGKYFEFQKSIQNLLSKREMLHEKLSNKNTHPSDFEYINSDINNIDSEIDNLFNERKECKEVIVDWKATIVDYCKAECKEVEKNVERNVKQEVKEISDKKNLERLETANNLLNDLKQQTLNKIDITLNSKEFLDSELNKLSDTQDFLKNNAGKLNLNYDKKYEPKLTKEKTNSLYLELAKIKESLSNLDSNISNIDKDYSSKKSQIENLLSTCNNISYNLKHIEDSTIDKTKTEENNFKKLVVDKFEKLQIQVYQKKLDAIEHSIDNKNNLRKFFDKLTGKNKIDTFQKLEIQRQRTGLNNALNNIENTNSVKKYSIHETISNIDTFCKENNNDNNLKSNLDEIAKFKNSITEIFNIDETSIKNFEPNSNSKNLNNTNNKLDTTPQVIIQVDKWLSEHSNKNNLSKDIKNTLSKYEYDDDNYYTTINTYEKKDINLSSKLEKTSEKYR